MNLALIHFLFHHLEYPDKRLAADLSHGMPIVGEVPPTGVLRPRTRPQRVDADSWRESIPQRNRQLLAKVVKTGPTKTARLCWGQTIADAKLGWVTQPIPVSEHVLDSLPLPPRFGQMEEHGGQVSMLRVIDDLKASQVNDLLGLVETSVP